MFSKKILLSLTGGIVLYGACLVRSNKENLSDALFRYNAAVRWGRTEWMADYIPKSKQAEFLARRQDFGELQITSCEVGVVKMKGKGKAVAMVQINWYLVGQGRLRTSYVSQEWKQNGGDWQIVDQHLVRGAPYPLLIHSPFSQRLKDQQLWPKNPTHVQR